MSVSKAAKY